ncbi:Elongation factor 1-beta [Methanofollis liminatans DSM 4140]|uniref:Elongation factor 1-beta n=1 Tax=Methanofollis liminatans DSM 4140 TaxID=28892 RepID=J0S6S6_9EURY|nr:elongation factor 1-beta [Methanofollis liminatans]EJG06249.1 Elongation factor 1-beta [Methanofollis liminatans DSM 4140]
MGKVAVILKLMPESADVPIEELEKRVKETVSGIDEIRAEPIGFGLSALKVAAVIEDEEGATDALESRLEAVDGIATAQIVDVNRMI